MSLRWGRRAFLRLTTGAVWNERDPPWRSNRVPAVRIRGLATKPDSLGCSHGRGDATASERVADHPGLFPLSCIRHDVAEEPSVLIINPEQQDPWNGVLMKDFIVPSVNYPNLIGMYFKKSVFELFGMRLLQEWCDALVDKQVWLFHLEWAEIRNASKCCDVIISQPALWSHWRGDWDFESLEGEQKAKGRAFNLESNLVWVEEQ